MNILVDLRDPKDCKWIYQVGDYKEVQYFGDYDDVFEYFDDGISFDDIIADVYGMYDHKYDELWERVGHILIKEFKIGYGTIGELRPEIAVWIRDNIPPYDPEVGWIDRQIKVGIETVLKQKGMI